MTDVLHTPGPWAELQEYDWGAESFNGEGCSWTAVGAEGKVVALPVWDGHYADPEFEANARLIAAAPELLGALIVLFADYKALADSGDAGNWRLEDQAAGIMAQAAIAKARGAS